MKKLPVIALLGLTALCAAPVTAQERINPHSESELYCVNIPIQKVYPYRKGYVVIYRSGANNTGTLYIPFEWFGRDVLKAQIVQIGSGKTWPCMSVFYKDGAFHSVRLYVSRYNSHQSWGSIPSNVNIDDRFEGVETLNIKY
ncbi:MAG: hypothetical protein LBH35_07470 [Treponema sp.]|jgi:hypothetical protein|nr:hypothetical protein [Treponema sp.]